jgi:hypothetical protein
MHLAVRHGNGTGVLYTPHRSLNQLVDTSDGVALAIAAKA